jgi:Ca2+-binding EF-hand superfamily protein
VQELKDGLLRLAVDVTTAQAKQWLSEADLDGEGHITLAEFTDVMLRLIMVGEA